jgi:ankyrin repeat protein
MRREDTKRPPWSSSVVVPRHKWDRDLKVHPKKGEGSGCSFPQAAFIGEVEGNVAAATLRNTPRPMSAPATRSLRPKARSIFPCKGQAVEFKGGRVHAIATVLEVSDDARDTWQNLARISFLPRWSGLSGQNIEKMLLSSVIPSKVREMSATLKDVIVCDREDKDLGLATVHSKLALRRVPEEKDFPLRVMRISGSILTNSQDDWIPCVPTAAYNGSWLQPLRYPPTCYRGTLRYPPKTAATDRSLLLQLIETIGSIAPCDCDRPTEATVEEHDWQEHDWQDRFKETIGEIWKHSACAKVIDAKGRDLGTYLHTFDQPELRSFPNPEQFPLKVMDHVCKQHCRHCALKCDCQWLADLKNLVTARACVNGVTPAGETPLIVAVRGGQLRVAAALVALRADVASASANHWTALHEAAKHGRQELCLGLLRVDSSAQNITAGEKPEKAAVMLGQSPPPSPPSRTPRRTLISPRDGSLLPPSALQKLANRRCCIRGSTPLLEAVERGSAQMVEDMIKFGGIVNLALDDGTTALMRAASRGHLEVCAVLLDHGVHVCEGDRGYRCCYHCRKVHHTGLKNDRGDSALSIARGASRYSRQPHCPGIVHLFMDRGVK